MVRIFFYPFLLLLFTCCTYAQVSPTADTALLQILQVKNDTLRMDSLYGYGRDKVDAQPKDAVNVGKILLEDAKTNEYRRGAANANRLIAEGYFCSGNYPQSLKYYLDALSIYNELNLYRSQINVLLGVASIYDVTGDMGSQEKYVDAAMAIGEQHKDIKNVRKMQPVILDFMATICKKEGRYDTSIKLYKQAIELARRDSDKNQIRNSLCNLATALKSDKKFDESLAAYNEVITMTDTANERYAYAIICDNMAILFYQMRDMKRSEQYALKTLGIVKKTNEADVLRDAYETLTNIYTDEKKYPDALNYSLKWSAIKDTILNHEKAQQLTQWQTKYDSEAKDKEIADQKKQLSYNLKINLSLTVISMLFLLLVLITYRSYNAQKRSNALLSSEKKRSEDLLLNILPDEVANELKDKGSADAKHFDNVTVLFTDFVNFTKASERMSPQQLISELHFCFKAFDEIIDKYNIEKIKTIGDSYLAVSGLPVAEPMHAENIIMAAIEINTFVDNRNRKMGDATFEVRIGIHSGSVVAGIVGVKKFSYDIWGDTVNTAARMEQNSEPGKINISQTTYNLVKDKFACVYRGEIEAKNKGLMKMYFVV